MKKKNRSGDIGDKNVPLDMSQMSLSQRAKLAALVEADGDEALRTHLLGAMGRSESGRGARAAREVPVSWSIIHTLDRIEEAYVVLACLPAGTRPKEFGTAWPEVTRQKMTHLEWIEAYRSGELAEYEEEKNRVRIPPTTAQITRMEQALAWPFQYLADRPELARAIQLRALWASMGVNIRKRCERRGMDHDGFNRDWQTALSVITGELITRKVPVS